MIRNILDYLEHSAECYPDKVAFADDKDKCTYREESKSGWNLSGTANEEKKSDSCIYGKGSCRSDSVYGSGACGLLLCSAGSEASGREA